MKQISLVLGVLAVMAAVTGNAQQAAPTPTPAQSPTATTETASPSLADALQGSWRDAKNVARDAHRHPKETLTFFGVAPAHTVIEVTPGGGWYAEILAPYLGAQGQYIAAVVDPASAAEGGARDYQQRSKTNLETKFAADGARYGKARTIGFDPAAPNFGPANSADVVLTFRNVHNWRGAGQAEGMFKGFYNVLKPGAVLGVVEHRAAADVPADDKSGYVGQAQVIAMAEAAGFELAEASEINANPKDTKDHSNGVWTLPPVSRHEPADAEKYKAIGESDRMTLKFVKPAN